MDLQDNAIIRQSRVNFIIAIMALLLTGVFMIRLGVLLKRNAENELKRVQSLIDSEMMRGDPSFQE